MKFLRRLLAKLDIHSKTKKLANHQASAASLKIIRSHYQTALADEKYTKEIADSFRQRVFKLAAEIEYHDRQAAHLALHIQILKDSLKC